MIVATIVLFRKRNIISFALAFYLLHLFLVSNFVFDLGATMGERLIYHSSFGFVLIVAIGFNFLLQKINYPVVKKAIIVSGCIVLVYWSAAKDIQRNAEWKNNNTLFLSDVKAVPNSAFTNGGAGASLIDAASAVNDPIRERQILDSAIGYLKKSILIHNRYVNGYLNLGYAYFLEKNYDSAKISWDRGKEIFPANTFLPAYYTNLAAAYSNKGVEMIKSTQPELGVQLFEKAVACTPNDIDLLNNLGTSYYFIRKDAVKASQQWERSLQIQPGNKGAMDGMALLNKK
jgi:tetratricopeptide (TPR) repeat protein